MEIRPVFESLLDIDFCKHDHRLFGISLLPQSFVDLEDPELFQVSQSLRVIPHV